jgi:hypothetical protein
MKSSDYHNKTADEENDDQMMEDAAMPSLDGVPGHDENDDRMMEECWHADEKTTATSRDNIGLHFLKMMTASGRCQVQARFSPTQVR